MARHTITVTVESKRDDIGDASVYEALFDFGIPNPLAPSEHDHLWPNNEGLDYKVVGITVAKDPVV